MNPSEIYSQIVFNRTSEDVSQFESQRGKAPYTPGWILKITWDHVLPVSYQKINLSEVRSQPFPIQYQSLGQILPRFKWWSKVLTTPRSWVRYPISWLM